MTERLRIEYMRLSDIRRYAKNAKDHDLGLLSESVYRFGFNEPMTIAENWHLLAAGHGRLDTLERAKEDGEPLPDHIDAAEDGEWLVPVVRGVSFRDEHELRAYIIAANRTTEAGGWHEDLLLAELQALAEADVPLDGVGYDLDDLDMMLRDAAIADDLRNPEPESAPAQQHAEAPAPTFGVVVMVADQMTEDALVSLLEANEYTARRLADPLGRFHAFTPKGQQPPEHDHAGGESESGSTLQCPHAA